LELSQRGNNLSVDLTVGDIYGEEGYPKVLMISSEKEAFYVRQLSYGYWF
jgi:type II pantothenate kinase